MFAVAAAARTADEAHNTQTTPRGYLERDDKLHLIFVKGPEEGAYQGPQLKVSPTVLSRCILEICMCLCFVLFVPVGFSLPTVIFLGST